MQEPFTEVDSRSGCCVEVDVCCGGVHCGAMHLSELTQRAMEIRERFAAYEQRRVGRTWTREEIMQGFVVDVGDLMKLVMAKAGARRVDEVDAKLAHELSDCLWSVLVLAQLYGFDLEREFLRTMDELERGTSAAQEQEY